MPSKNMLPKGKRRQSVKKEYRAQRTLAQERASAGEELQVPAANMIETAGYTEAELTLEERVAANDWITTRGASGSKVAAETQEERRYGNPYAALHEKAAPEIQAIEDLEAEDGVRSFAAEPAAAGMRLDAYLAKAIPDISRRRVQMLIEAGQVTVDGEAVKAKHKLRGGELIEIEGEPRLEPLQAEAEDLPLTIVYEDEDLAVVDKAAGMMVHAGAGGLERNRGTLVNALLFHLGKGSPEVGGGLSQVGGMLRPGIVHRLDKQTSGLIVVAKNDVTHRKLGEMFAERRMRKVYLALVHGWMEKDEGTIALPIARDVVRRTRMTTRRSGGRSAVSHWKVLEKIAGPYGKFTLVEVRIETGRTHQIRVHLSAVGHPVVGDALYGAPHRVQAVSAAKAKSSRNAAARVEDGAGAAGFSLERNFLHAAELDFAHPRTGEPMELRTGLPGELVEVLERVRG